MNKQERQWMDAISQLGCCVCSRSPVQIHHLLSGGRRIGHLSSIPLCQPHHQGGFNDAKIVSRHPYKRAFEERYGTEQQLLERVRERVRAAV